MLFLLLLLWPHASKSRTTGRHQRHHALCSSRRLDWTGLNITAAAAAESENTPHVWKSALAKMKRVASHDIFVWITSSFIPLNSCHPKVISIIMASILPNGILAVIMCASASRRHDQPCHPELHKCNYINPLITKQCNLLPEWNLILDL